LPENLSILLLPRKAIAAIHGPPVLAGAERKAGDAAAGRAGGFEHFALAAAAAAAALAGFAAILAAAGFVLEAFFSVELLFAGGKDEFVAAFLADERLVFAHVPIYLA